MAVFADLGALADDISAHHGYLDVLEGGWGTELPYSCADIVAAQEAGEDPTHWWREAVCAAQTDVYGVPGPPSVGAAFVLGWYLQVVAVPLAFAAALRDWLPDASPEAVRFDLADGQWFPVAVSLAPGPTERIPQPQLRFLRAREKYEEHARRFADSYRPGVKMSSRQRYGLVRDTWAEALDGARTQVLHEPSRLTLRESCCFIYALPGALACARCPRNAAVSCR